MTGAVIIDETTDVTGTLHLGTLREKTRQACVCLTLGGIRHRGVRIKDQGQTGDLRKTGGGTRLRLGHLVVVHLTKVMAR